MWSVGDDLNGNYYGATANWGISATFESDSSWVILGDSYLGNLTIADGASISAPDGYTLEMTVNGQQVDIAPGSYTGEIIILVVGA